MFLLLLNGAVLNFWGNTPGDVFLKNTMSKLELNPEQIELVFYPGMKSPPGKYEFGEGRKILEKGEVTKIVDDVEVVEEDIINIYPAVIYFDKGIYHKPC